MTVEQMVQYLRLNVNVQNPDPDDPESIDPAFLTMTDEDLILYLEMALSQGNFVDPMQLNSNPPPLDAMQPSLIYLLVLYAKKDLYFALATKVAPLEDLGADNNNYIKRDQRFKHYMELIKTTDAEIKDYLDNANAVDGGGGTGGYVLTYDTTVANRYATQYNYNKSKPPTVQVAVQNIALDSFEIAWLTSYISVFHSYRVWVSKNPIIDFYSQLNPVATDAKLVYKVYDPHKSSCRITDLEPDTLYYVAVSATSRTGLSGYCQIQSFTLPLIDPEPEPEPIEPPIEP